MIAVGNDELRSHAERLLAVPVSRGDLALAFEESSAETAEVLVEGKNFYPRMLEDIAGAQTSVHINQFGFRPGADRGSLRRGASRQGERGRRGPPHRRQPGLGS